MENFEFKSQICTTKPQSEALLALGLKKETADMRLIWLYRYRDEDYYQPMPNDFSTSNDDIPAWSLHRLLFLIPKEVNIDGFKFPLRSDVIMRLEDADFIYQRLIGIIERVIQEGYFNKDYLEEKL